MMRRRVLSCLTVLVVAVAVAEEAPSSSGDDMVNATNATVAALYNLTDWDFDMRTRAMAGMTAGEWFVAFCCCDDACPVATLWDVAERMRDYNTSISVAKVDCDEQLALAVRFDVLTATKFIFFKDSRMYPYEEPSDNLWEWLNATALTLEGGPKIPRRAGPLKPLHDFLADFFDVVDYRALCMALGMAAVALVIVGAFMPHADAEDDKKKKDPDDEEEDENEAARDEKDESDKADKTNKKVSFAASTAKTKQRKKDD